VSLHVLRRVGDLGHEVVLAPERFDPRRRVEVASELCVADLVDAIAESASPRSLSADRPVLVLDTTHAYEGFVVLRHDPVAPDSLGSAKRSVEPGDVIVSRLRPYLRQVAYVDAALFQRAAGGNAVVVSPEFFVLRGRDGFDAACLVPFLLSAPAQAALAAGQEGGHHPRFSKDLLLSMRVPARVSDSPRDVADRVRDLAAALRGSLSGCRGLVEDLERSML